MHKLDPHTLFSIFEQGDEEIYKEHNVEDVLKNPYVLIGMVVTGIENFYFMDKMYSLKHPKHYGRVRDTIKNKYYNKLYRYLARLSPVEFDVIYKIGIDYELDKSLKSTIYTAYNHRFEPHIVNIKKILDQKKIGEN